MGKAGRSPRPPSQTGTSTLASSKKRPLLVRAAFGRYSAQTPPPSELWVSGGAPVTASANVCPQALFTCKAAPMPCAAITLLVCFIDTCHLGGPNAATQLSGTDPCRQETVDRENLKVANLEPQIEFFVETFSHELAKYLEFTVRRSVANLPRTPLRPLHQLLLLERSPALPNPAHRTRISRSAPACLRRDGSQHP